MGTLLQHQSITSRWRCHNIAAATQQPCIRGPPSDCKREGGRERNDQPDTESTSCPKERQTKLHSTSYCSTHKGNSSSSAKMQITDHTRHRIIINDMHHETITAHVPAWANLALILKAGIYYYYVTCTKMNALLT
eukprot:scpid29318/ scgid13728/ 